MNNMERMKAIRKRTRMTAKAFGAKYGIPAATIAGWEYGTSNPPSYVMNLLERAVNEDFGYESTIGMDVDKLREINALLADMIKKYE